MPTMNIMQVLEKKAFILEAAKQFYFKNFRIYPIYPYQDDNQLIFIVDHDKEKGKPDATVAFQNHLMRKIGCKLQVYTAVDLPILEKQNILAKCIDLDDKLSEEKILEAFNKNISPRNKILSTDKIIFDEKKIEDIDDISLIIADRLIKSYEQKKSQQSASPTQVIIKLGINSQPQNKRKSPEKEAGEKALENLSKSCEAKKTKLDEDKLAAFLEGILSSAKEMGVNVEQSISKLNLPPQNREDITKRPAGPTIGSPVK